MCLILHNILLLALKNIANFNEVETPRSPSSITTFPGENQHVHCAIDFVCEIVLLLLRTLDQKVWYSPV